MGITTIRTPRAFDSSPLRQQASIVETRQAARNPLANRFGNLNGHFAGEASMQRPAQPASLRPMKFDLRDLELFVAVADAGSIARAAERSHTVASAVSKRISDLEAGFDTALLVRGAKGIELTAAGHAFLTRARVLLHQAAQLDDEMRRHAAGKRGYVRVFANISAIVEFLPGSLASFAARHPDVHVHLEEHVSTATAAAVADNSADFGIVGELPVIDGLATTPFRSDELVVVMRPDHSLAKRKSLAFADIVDQPFV